MASLPKTKRRVKATRKVARHKVRDAIEKMILEGRVRPGEKLVQLQLSRMFDVSLGMIREALFELQRSGLIETFDNRGIFVRRLDEQAIREFYIVRELFEGLAARECCGRLEPQQAQELRRRADDIYQLAKSGQQRAKAAADREFHSRIVEISGNRLLIGMARQYHVLGKFVGAKVDAKGTRASHLAIVSAIEKGDPDESERAAREHVLRGLREIERVVASGDQELVWIA